MIRRTMKLAAVFLLLLISQSACTHEQQAGGRQNATDPGPLPALIPFRVGKLWGFSDPFGKMLVAAQFREAKILSDSLFYGYDKDKDNETWLYNSRAELIGRYSGEPRNYTLGDQTREDHPRNLILLRQKSPPTRDPSLGHSLSEPVYIFRMDGSFAIDSSAYFTTRETSASRLLQVGKKEGSKITWGLIDSSGSLVEPMAYAAISVCRSTYIRIKSTASGLMGALPGQAFHKWPVAGLNDLGEQIVPGVLSVSEPGDGQRRLMRYDGKIIASLSASEQAERVYGNDELIIIAGQPFQSLLRTDGVVLIPATDSFTHFSYNQPDADTTIDKNIIAGAKGEDFSSDFNGVYDIANRRFIILPESRYTQIRRISNDWLSMRRGKEQYLMQIRTGERLNLKNEYRTLPNANDWQLQYTQYNTYAWQRSSSIVRDLRNSGHTPVKGAFTFGPLLSTGVRGKMGAFNLQTWQQVLPPLFDSVNVLPAGNQEPEMFSLLWSRDGEGCSLYTAYGRKIWTGKFLPEWSATMAPYLMFSAGGKLHIADTNGRLIQTIPASEKFAFTRTGFAVASYDDESIAVRLSDGQLKKIDGVVDYLNHGTIRKNFVFLPLIKGSKTGQIDTRNFTTALPAMYDRREYSVFYDGRDWNPARVLFLVSVQYEPNGYRILGYVNRSGFQYWKD